MVDEKEQRRRKPVVAGRRKNQTIRRRRVALKVACERCGALPSIRSGVSRNHGGH
jgi:hypothetical protein